MRIPGCSQCLTGIEEARSTVVSNTSCDPLLITKRPIVKQSNENSHSHRRISIPMECRDASDRRVSRLPVFLRAMFNATWRRKRGRKNREWLETKRRVKKRDVFRKRESSSDDNGFAGRRIVELRNEALENEEFGEYCEHLEPLKFILEPPASFANEDHWNATAKLNSLDFRRINTIAIPHESTWNLMKFQNKFDEAMMCIIEREPILKRVRKSCLTRDATVFNKREGKTVRFKDDDLTVKNENTSVITPHVVSPRLNADSREMVAMESMNKSHVTTVRIGPETEEGAIQFHGELCQNYDGSLYKLLVNHFHVNVNENLWNGGLQNVRYLDGTLRW
ncbi:uncharacterized protein LOC135162391 [Diachasmimorpha longicaudata]|uniref:uncharacterized protein LOC135162391 n=1 Tax=Diachasmimorpha longicaudata TaxID=58733 RepID=UPI0030B90550